MKKTHIAAVSVIAALMGAGHTSAQRLSSVQAPAEFPPETYEGRQYVDSNGCVFVRAGIDGNVTWVPRVSRDRKIICGFQPSLPGTASAVTVATTEPDVAQPEEEPVQITIAQPDPNATVEPVVVASATPAVQPLPEPVVTQPKRVKVQPVYTTQPVAVTVPQSYETQVFEKKPTTIRAVQPARKATHKTVIIAQAAPEHGQMAPRQSFCRGAGSYSSPYLGKYTTCYESEEGYVSLINGGNAHTVIKSVPAAPAYGQPLNRTRGAAPVSRTTRIVPEHVYNSQVASTHGVYIPEGYSAVWTDDRLNPKRAHYTLEGQAQMEQMWTNTVPRVLIGVQEKPGGIFSSKGVVPQQQVVRATGSRTSREAVQTRAATQVVRARVRSESTTIVKVSPTAGRSSSVPASADR